MSDKNDKRRQRADSRAKSQSDNVFIGPRGYQYQTVPKPTSFLDVFRYLKELIGGFVYRLFYIISLVWETGPWILFALFSISILTGLLPVAGSLVYKDVINELQTVVTAATAGQVNVSFLESPVVFLLVFFFLYRILTHVVGRIEASVTRIAGELVVKHIRVEMMNKAKEIDLAADDLPEFYEKLENANREAGMRPVSILSSTFAMVSTAISLVSYMIVLSTALPLATLCIILVSIPSAVVNFIYRRKNFGYMRHRSKERRQMNYYSDIMVNKDLVKEIRMFDLGDTFIEKFCKVFDHYYKGLRRLILSENLWSIGMIVLSSLVNCVFYLILAKGVFDGKYMIGDYSLYTGALVSISGYVTSLISTSATIYEGTLFIDNLITFVRCKPQIAARGEIPATLTRGSHTIEFQNVSFAYPGTEQLVLKNINLKFEQGDTVVLVGLNGAGKTTLIKLLTRLYDPTEGQILLDGVDLREYDPKELYKIFGIIFQDFGKYAVTVSENIQFGEIGGAHSAERVREAAMAANADDYILRLPNGYETSLMRFFEREGIELSIGQWQKLAIARAFYSDSDILILDEPTASLDAIAEQEIYDQFDRLRHDKTTIFVSHRLSSATVATKIVVLEYGEVVEEGNHRELMEKQGKYYELFTTQAKHYVADAEGKRAHRPRRGVAPREEMESEFYLGDLDNE